MTELGYYFDQLQISGLFCACKDSTSTTPAPLWNAATSYPDFCSSKRGGNPTGGTFFVYLATPFAISCVNANATLILNTLLMYSWWCICLQPETGNLLSAGALRQCGCRDVVANPNFSLPDRTVWNIFPARKTLARVFSVTVIQRILSKAGKWLWKMNVLRY